MAAEGRRLVYDGTDFYFTGRFYDSTTVGGIQLYTSNEAMIIGKVKGDLSSALWLDYSYPINGVAVGNDIELDFCNEPVGLGTWNLGVDGQVWLYHYSADGDYLGGLTFDGGADNVEGLSLEIGTSGYLFMGARFQSNLLVLNGDSINNPNNDTTGFVSCVNICLLDAVTATADNYSLSYSSQPTNLTGYPSGGTFSGSGVTGTQFDPSLVGPGSYDVVYTYTTCNGCSDSDTITIDVDCYPNVNFSEYTSVHQELTQNFPNFKRKESDYFVDSVPHPEIPGAKIGKNRLITVATSQDNNGDVYVALIEDDGDVIWTKQFGGSAKDRGTAAKKCNDGYLIAGTTLSYGSSYLKPFILKLDQNGSVVWFKYYEIDNHVLSVNVVELNNGDIAMTGFFNAHEYPGQPHDFFVLTTNSSGSLINFKQFGKPARSWEYIRDIEATSDGGFVITGNSGHAGDYHAGLVMKFNSSYNPQWAKEIRRILPSYNLNVAGQRTNIFFTAIKEEANGDFIVTGRISDHNGAGQGATFKHGILVRLTAVGNISGHVILPKNTNDFLIIHNVVKNSSNEYVVTGKTKDLTTGQEHSFLVNVNSSLTTVNFAVEYELHQFNEGLSLWQSANGGYTFTGLTGETSSDRKPFVIKTNSTGGTSNEVICDYSFTVTPYIESIEDIDYNWTETLPEHYYSSSSIDSLDVCVLLRDCSNMGVSSGRLRDVSNDIEMNDWLDIEPEENSSTLSGINKLDFSPNPSRETIKFLTNVKHVQVMDMTGRIVKEYQGTEINTFNVESLETGSYIIKAKEVNTNTFKSSILIIK